MKFDLNGLLPFLGKYWLRIGVIGLFCFLLNQKQLDLSIQLGLPDGEQLPVQERLEPLPPSTAPQPVVSEQPSILTEANPHPTGNDQLTIVPTGSSGERSILALDAHSVRAFLQRFVAVARTEQEKYGVPASITLAAGLLQSQAGQGKLVKEANNFFALSCTQDWSGASVQQQGRCYRAYQNAWTSFRDHSLYVTTGAYSALPALGPDNYRQWAVALEKTGYPGGRGIGQQLLGLVEAWQLHQYDNGQP